MRSNGSVVALVLSLAACWRGEPAAPPPAPAPPPRPVRTRTTPPVPQVDLSDPVVLQSTLRTNPRLALQDLGPIVVADLDAGTIDTLCDHMALDAQDSWGTLFSDATRNAPSCRRNFQTLTCTQVFPPMLLIVNFTATPPIRPISALVGMPRSGTVTMQSLQTALQNAQCP